MKTSRCSEKQKVKNTIIVINKSDLISSEEQKSRRAEVNSALSSYSSR